MTFGVGVEGPSDYQFWHKVLHKHFRGCRFDVRNMKNRDKLIRETPKLLETFRDCHYTAGFILVDRDDDPCLGSVLGMFGAAIRNVARAPDRNSRFLHVCIAVKEVESWYLADADAVNAVNRLIFGDNLLALKALEQEFTGQIKCIYIDPPYNTGAHSSITMMESNIRCGFV